MEFEPNSKRLSGRRGTARRSVSVAVLNDNCCTTVREIAFTIGEWCPKSSTCIAQA